MPPVQGSKFAVLASPEEDEAKKAKAQQQQSKNAKKNAKKKQQQQTKVTEAIKPKEPVKQVAKAVPVVASTASSSKATPKAEPAKPVPPKKSPKSSPTSVKPSPPGTTAQSMVESGPTNPRGSTVQSIFLWAVSACYLFAFVSFYYQIRGLYGDDGVLPLSHYASSFAPKNQSIGANDLYDQTGSVVWLVARSGFTLTSALELVTLAGVLLSFGQLLFSSLRVAPNYIVLFLCYSAISKVGQTFLHFQWDALLLEVGIVTVVASVRGRFAPDSRLVLWPTRWLLFKFMLSSGVVKLTSRCPLWWSLGALDVHFESQCIPTPLAWYIHHLPTNWLHLATALTYVLEILGPFLFFVPLRSARRFSFITQALFQISIIATGNYNFFNFLTLALCFSLVECPGTATSGGCPAKKASAPATTCRFKLATQGVFFGLVGYFVVHYFAVSFDNINSLTEVLTVGPTSKINFTFEDFNLFLTYAITASIWMGVISLVHFSVRAILLAISSSGCVFTRTIKLSATLFAILACIAFFTLSLVPLADLDTSGQYARSLPAPVKRWYETANENGFVSGYGLFRVMTGAEGRPELIIEGTNDPSNESWKPYHFKYKPGDLATMPGFNIPHQPRLDWQMWFAALGTYQSNPWLLNLAYRLLTAQPDVLNLLDTQRLPFPHGSPPKYLRISRYLYKFTDNLSDGNWWKQTSNRHAYMPMVTKDTLSAALKHDEIAIPLWVQELAGLEATQHPTVKRLLDQLYQVLVLQSSPLLAPHLVMGLLFLAAFFYQWSRCTKKCPATTASTCPMSACPAAR